MTQTEGKGLTGTALKRQVFRRKNRGFGTGKGLLCKRLGLNGLENPAAYGA